MADMAVATLATGPIDFLQAALGLVILTDLSLLGAERQRLCIRFIALQGTLLGLLPLVAHAGPKNLHLILSVIAFVAIKGVFMPYLLARTYKKLPPQPPITPYLGYTACVFLGLAAFVFSLWLSDRVGDAANPIFTLFLPAAFATILTGLILIMTRKEALAQMFGYLIAENGIFLLGVPMAHVDAIWLELSILLDILAGVFVMGIAIHHIHSAFDSTDVGQFANLRD